MLKIYPEFKEYKDCKKPEWAMDAVLLVVCKSSAQTEQNIINTKAEKDGKLTKEIKDAKVKATKGAKGAKATKTAKVRAKKGEKVETARKSPSSPPIDDNPVAALAADTTMMTLSDGTLIAYFRSVNTNGHIRFIL